MTDPRSQLGQSQTATNAAKLPALVVPKSLDDEQGTLRWMRSITERSQTREGERGNPLERAVTHRELQQTYGIRSVVTAGGKPGTILVQDAQGNTVALSAEHFASMIQSTRLWQDLVTSLSDQTRFDAFGDRVKALLLPDLAQIAAQRGAAVQQLQTIIQNGTESFAAQKTEITAAIGQLAAGVRETLWASANDMIATAGKALQITARLDDFNGGTSTVEEVFSATASRIDGLAAEWYIKVNAGNAVANIGLSADEDPSGATHSAFIVQADQMAFTAAPNFSQETTPTATAAGQLWYKPSTKAWSRSTGTGTTHWVSFTPKVPLGIDTINDAIYIDGSVLINSGGTALEDIAALETYWISSSYGAITKNTDGSFSPSAATFSANYTNGSVTVGSYPGRFKIATTPDGSAFTDQYTSGSNETSHSYTVSGAPSGTIAIRARLYATGGTTDLLDEVIVPIVVAGSNAITVVLSNPSQTLPSDSSGNVSSYSNSGTTIQVYEGANLLTYTTGTIGNSKFKIGTPTVSPSGKITVGSISGNGTTTATVANHSAMDAATASVQVTYPLTIQKADGTSISWNAIQVITKSAAGSNGSRGSFLGNGFQYGIRTNTWSDNLANRVIENMNTGSTSTAGISGGSMTPPGRVLGDQVTLGNGNPWWTTTGTYNSGTAYNKNDITIYSGSAYRAVQSSTNKQPDTNPTYWISLGTVNATGAWAAVHTYSQNDTATSGGVTYLAKWKHVSDASSIANDLATADVAMTKMWDGAQWLLPGVTINGNLIVLGTIGARMFDGVGLQIGTGRSFSGFALEVNSAGVVSADNLFVEQAAQFENNSSDTNPAVNVFGNVAGKAALTAQVVAGVTSSTAYAIQGVNNHFTTEGRVGTNTNAFYAVSGTAGPFTGAHDVLVPKTLTTLEIGDILVDDTLIARRDVSNTLFAAVASTTASQRGAIGVLSAAPREWTAQDIPAALIVGFEDVEVEGSDGRTRTQRVPIASDDSDSLAEEYDWAQVNALGEGQMNVCGEGGDIAAGDLIVCSSTAGKGMKQADDLVHNYTVAKAREAVTFSDPSDVKTIACIYLCG